jgi:hypothetical protein
MDATSSYRCTWNGVRFVFPPSAEPLHEYIEKYQKIFITLLVKIFLKIWCSKLDVQHSDLIVLSQLWRYLSNSTTEPEWHWTRRNRSGREVVMSNGINLTIKDRTHHATAVLTVVESAAAKQMFCWKDSEVLWIIPKNSEGNYKMYVMKTIRS